MSQVPHILFVEMGTGIGGANRCLHALVEACRQQKWRVSVACAYPDPDLPRLLGSSNWLPLYADPTFRRGLRIRRVRKRASRDPWRWESAGRFLTALCASDLPVAVRLSRFVHRTGVDLVHANNDLLANRVAIIAAKRAGIPVISHQRGWPHACWASLRLCRWADHLVAVSDSVAESLRKMDAPSNRILRIYDGVDAGRFTVPIERAADFRRRLGFLPQHEVVGLPAILLPWKGQDLFLRAFARVAEQRPLARAVLIGSSPANAPNYRPALERRVIELGLNDRVAFAGHVGDMAAAYAALDLVVHASVKPEPFGLVVLEAMASERAVLAADCAGPAEIIRHGRDGWLYPMGDVSALSAAMERLLSDPGVRADLAAAAPLRAATFDPARTNAQFLRLVATALHRPEADPSLASSRPHNLARPRKLTPRRPVCRVRPF